MLNELNAKEDIVNKLIGVTQNNAASDQNENGERGETGILR